jgi:hypothetical protein
MSGDREHRQGLKIALYIGLSTIDGQGSRYWWTDLHDLHETMLSARYRDRSCETKCTFSVAYGATEAGGSKGTEVPENNQRLEEAGFARSIGAQYDIGRTTKTEFRMSQISK